MNKRIGSSDKSPDDIPSINGRTWQDILNELVDKAMNDGLIKKIKNEKSLEGKLSTVLNSVSVRNKISSWISQCSESQYWKNGPTATRLRDEGNHKFRLNDNDASLKLYTESIISAPELGPELSLAFANRSACLYHKGNYEKCLQDISLALRYKYPKRLEYKLQQRKGQCLTKLKYYKESEKAFLEAINALDFDSKMSIEKRQQLHKDIEALMRENNSQANKCDTNTNESKHETVLLENKIDSLKLKDTKQSNNISNQYHYSQQSVKLDNQIQMIPRNGYNSQFPSASASLKIMGNENRLDEREHDKSEAQISQSEDEIMRGRYVVSTNAIEIGSILFSELPYSSVLLPEHYSTHCHHCYERLIAPIPCLRCTQTRYCSDSCRQESWDIYHQYECKCLDLLHSVGIAHLSVRTVIVTGVENLISYRSTISKLKDHRKDVSHVHPKSIDDISSNDGEKTNEDNDPYHKVINLITHVDNLDAIDLFQYVVTAALLTTYLEKRTKFFDYCLTSEMSSTKTEFENSRPLKTCGKDQVVDKDIVTFVGSIVLRHITQLICNASAIYEVGPSKTSDICSDIDYNVKNGLEPVQEGGEVISNTQYRIATAIYPSASMMNHSCNPSVINSFYGKRLIVKAIKNILTGEEVFNCYGPHFRRHTFHERQEMLTSQYHFVCKCNSCEKKEIDDFQDRFSALKCTLCGGPIKNPHSESSLNHKMPCLDCGEEQEYKEQIQQVFLAYDLYSKGMEFLRFGNMTDTLSALQSCYQLRTKAMYAHHLEVTEVADQLARCYAMMGSFSESAQYLKVCLPAIQERFGDCSIEVGHELVKYTDVLLGELQDSTKRISLYEEKVFEAESCLEKAAQIFELHYGSWNTTYQEIIQRLEKIRLLTNDINSKVLLHKASKLHT